MSDSSNGNHPKLSEKGLLTPDNGVVALIDHQPQMLFGTSNFERQTIMNNTVAFAKASRVFDVPVVMISFASTAQGKCWSFPVRISKTFLCHVPTWLPLWKAS